LSDTTDALPFKGHLRSDQDDIAYQEYLETEAVAMATAYRGTSPETGPDVLRTMAQEFAMSSGCYERWIYECSGCGRLLIPSNTSRRYEAYLPEGESRGILKALDKDVYGVPTR
jgi:hypothetical protein